MEEFFKKVSFLVAIVLSFQLSTNAAIVNTKDSYNQVPVKEKKHCLEKISDITSLRPFSDSTFWKFQKYLGNGTMKIFYENNVETFEFCSIDKYGFAASVNSVPLIIDPGYEYIVTMDIKTENLLSKDAKLVGAPYFDFFDKYSYPASWYPIADLRPGPACYLAPQTTDWITVKHHIKTPTTSNTAQIILAYAAFMEWNPEIRNSNPEYKEMPLTCIFERLGTRTRNKGKATGKLWIRNVKVERGAKVAIHQTSIHVPDSTLQQSIEIANACLHNAQLSGDFKVSAGYITSGNIIPDLAFGFFGVRRLDNPDYIETMSRYWKMTAESMDTAGRITSQRVMSQVFFPLGVDEIFSFTGDLNYLAENLPLADKALEYAINRRDANGLIRLVEYGKWHISEGADWVDWYPTRMEGKTIMFQLWYLRALQRLASLHEEFKETVINGKKIGSKTKADLYCKLAKQVEQSVRKLYWIRDHFVTNVDYGGKIADEIWLDNQVWAIKFGVATKEQTKKIWSFIDADPMKYEGVPTRWAAFDGPVHGPLTWFGRNGGGDIMARYKTGMCNKGLGLLHNISCVFNRYGDIYEAYDMQGNIIKGTSGWGNYTEHSGGYIWTVVEGVFGFNFDSDEKVAATMKPNFPNEWESADITVFIRGTKVRAVYSSEQNRQLQFTGEGTLQKLCVILPNGKKQIIIVGDGKTQTVIYH